VPENKSTKINNKINSLYEEFGSSLAANVIAQGPRDVIDLRGQLLRGSVQCGDRIAEFMVPQDIACALTAGDYQFRKEADTTLKHIADNHISLAEAEKKADGLIRAAGDAATVLTNLKKADLHLFLQVLTILWKYGKESKRGKDNSLR